MKNDEIEIFSENIYFSKARPAFEILSCNFFIPIANLLKTPKMAFPPRRKWVTKVQIDFRIENPKNISENVVNLHRLHPQCVILGQNNVCNGANRLTDPG